MMQLRTVIPNHRFRCRSTAVLSHSLSSLGVLDQLIVRGVQIDEGYFFDVSDGKQKPWEDYRGFTADNRECVVGVEHIGERHVIVNAVEARLKARQPLPLLTLLRLLFDWDAGNLELTTCNRHHGAGAQELVMVEHALDGGAIVVDHLRSALGSKLQSMTWYTLHLGRTRMEHRNGEAIAKGYV
jgi:hypothetical protein